MSFLEVKGLKFSYGEKEVLGGISFDVAENNIVSVLGPNGVGKTTLLKCICRMYRADEGSILLDGKNIFECSPNEFAKRVAYVPQQAKTSKTTVFDTVLIGRKPHASWSMGEDDLEKAWGIMECLGLRDIALKNTDEISGGEFQKVHIARAIAQNPGLLVLDEPSNNLDIANQHITLGTIEHLVRKHGLCALMTMHDINLAVYYSDRFLFVKDGKIAAYGGKEVITPEVIREVYGIDAEVIEHKGRTVVIPIKGPSVCDRSPTSEHTG